MDFALIRVALAWMRPAILRKAVSLACPIDYQTSGWEDVPDVVGGVSDDQQLPLRLVSVAKLVDFERGEVSYAEFIGITVLPWG